jgi:hypothetical protein
MAKWNWLKGLRCMAGVGATLMVSSVAMAGDVSPITDVANPDHVFSQTSYNLAGEVCGAGSGCGTSACGNAGCRTDGCSGCDDGCDMFGLRCDQEKINFFEGVEVGGWAQFGYTSETTLFNGSGQEDDFQLNQGWIYLEKAAESKCGEWAFGYRGDFVYGVDGPNTQSFGNSLRANGTGSFDLDTGFTRGAGYGWAIPQLYVEATNGDTTIKSGHFYTLHGYEVVTAPDNFFFTRAYSMNNSEPFTHTGVVVTQAVGDDTEVYAGWTAGWDTGFARQNDGSNFLGGFSTALTDDVSFTYIFSWGNFGLLEDGYAHSAVIDWQINDKLNYVLHHDLLRTDRGPTAAAPGGSVNDVVAINQYLIYQVTDCVGVGGRAEWWKAEGTSVYALTGGVNIKPHSQVTIRPEVKYDWSPGGEVAADGNNGFVTGPINGSNETTFSVDVIFTF